MATCPPAGVPRSGGRPKPAIRGLSTEIPVEPATGLDYACVVSWDHIVTMPKSALDLQIGYLLPRRKPP
jgi:mRNA-degrading endonuclease toxin of MazEF toxin-antitoxin module